MYRNNSYVSFLPPVFFEPVSEGLDLTQGALEGTLKYENVFGVSEDEFNNGERFHTYIILAEPGSGTFSMNGAAARKVAVGDRVIIATYGHFNEAELLNHKPKLVYLNEDNTVNRTTNTIPMQVA